MRDMRSMPYGLLWPVMACYAVKKFSHVFTRSLLSSSFPGQPRLQGSNAQPVFEPHFRAADKTNASCHPSQLDAELLLEFWWNFGALYTQSLHDTLTLYITWYPLYLRNSLG